MTKKGKKLGIIGLGKVGLATKHALSYWFECVGYDIIGEHSWDDILKTDCILICVSTPTGNNGRLNCSNVDDVLTNLNSDSYSGLIIIKSTIAVGFMEKSSHKYPKLRLVYMPEFLRERSNFVWFVNPDRLIFSGSVDDCNEALIYFHWVEDAEIQVLDHRSAELGKLAHNAYIATKVSFTNEIENICSEIGGDPEKIMGVIWADRRVKSNAHLIPKKGSYSGGCVPKDTHELILASSKSVLLKAVEEVKIKYDSTQNSDYSVVTIIPTKDRPNKLFDALNSVQIQEKKPDRILVITDSSLENYTKEEIVVSGFSQDQNISLIKNNRTKNLSGAVNTALLQLISEEFNPNNTYISILDDDDTWNPKYIKSCYNEALDTNNDWIISGIIRYESISKGHLQKIPNTINTDEFFAGNPNIQGSNLFIRFSRLLEAGGFDEKMVSTTDRDLCIRLSMLPNITYCIINDHLVNHYALNDPCRLSYPKSERKKQGLEYFYHKYSPLMSSDIEIRFLNRCNTLFGINIENTLQNGMKNKSELCYNCQNTFSIIVGFSAKRSDSTNTLLNDLQNISDRGLLLSKIIIIDDFIDGTDSLISLVSGYTQFISIKVITRKEIAKMNKKNAFGFNAVGSDGKGISSIRTVLHHYLYAESKGYENPAIWILDDDVRLEFYDENQKIRKIDPEHLIADFSNLKNNGFDFAVGPITGDPPIPAMSIVRTQLLDLYYNLVKEERRTTKLNKYNVESDPDYYYDYSDLHYTHLENPIWTNDLSKNQLIDLFIGISHGKSVTRPCFSNNEISKYTEHSLPLIRGGNSVIFNPECLRQFHTISPLTNGIRWKRGDSLWSLFSMMCGGFKAGKMLTGVRHERTQSNGAILSDTILLSDFWGSSLIKALNDYYHISGKNEYSLSETDVQWIIQKFYQYLNHRLDIFYFNSYRIRGLSSMIRDLPLSLPESLLEIIDDIDLKYSDEKANEIIKSSRNVDYNQIKTFLLGLENSFIKFRGGFE